MPNSPQPIGFYADVQFLGEDEALSRYFSFGEWDEDSDEDGYGVYDGNIFYYPSLDEVKSLEEYSYEGWTIIPNSITYIYDSKEVL